MVCVTGLVGIAAAIACGEYCGGAGCGIGCDGADGECGANSYYRDRQQLSAALGAR